MRLQTVEETKAALDTVPESSDEEPFCNETPQPIAPTKPESMEFLAADEVP